MREFIVAAGLLLLALAVLLFLVGGPGPAIFATAFLGLALSVGPLIEGRYKPLRDGTPGPGWTDTGERFIDPETGKQVAVFVTSTGERAYRTLARGQSGAR